MPVAFMSGVIGKFFLQFGVTLSVAVAISYVEAISLAPARCAQMLRAPSHASRGVVGRFADRGFERLSRGYAWALAHTLRWPWVALAVAAGVLALAGLTATRIPQEFVPSQDQSRLSVRINTAVGANLAATDVLARRAEAILLDRPEVADVVANVSSGSASFSVTMVPPRQRKLTQQQFSAQIRNQLNAIPGVRASVQDLSQQGFGGSKGYPLEFSVRGSDWDTLVKLAASLQSQASASGLITDVNSDYQLGTPELVIAPDRARATDLGVSVQDIASTVSAMVGGVVVGQYSNAGRRMDINVRLTAAQRSRPEDLELLRVRTATGALVPLSSVVATSQQAELQQINHADRERAITITGNVAPGHAQNEAIAYAQSLASSLPPGYRVVLGGQSSQFGDAMSSLLFALVVGILVAYMILASQFNSFLHPVTVLTILPLSIAGAMFALFVTGKTLNIFSMIGLLLLMGIVKKNSIILVDYAAEVRHKEKVDAVTAMLHAGPVRLRPILMTAVATMMAAVPSALGLGPGAETRGPMADAVIGGLVLSTALSLLVVPAFYVVADRLTGRRRVGAAAPISVPRSGEA
jgi:multidrug efflux pump subunit AcrB